MGGTRTGLKVKRRQGAYGLKETEGTVGGGGGYGGFERGGGARLSQAGMMVHGSTGELDDERSGEKGWSADPGWHKVWEWISWLASGFAAGAQRCGGVGFGRWKTTARHRAWRRGVCAWENVANGGKDAGRGKGAWLKQHRGSLLGHLLYLCVWIS